MPRSPSRFALAAAAALAALSPRPARPETAPPGGPPWRADLLAADREALAAGEPIFIYAGKPH